MKKILPCLLFIFILFGCDDSNKSIKPEDMNQGYIHFAANLVLEDIFRKGETSIYAQLAPSNILNPYNVLYADNIINDFRRNFATAEDQYHRLRGTGTVIKGSISHVDHSKQEIIYEINKPNDKIPFTGTLRLSLDKDLYNDSNMPSYTQGQTAAFMCSEYRPVHDFKNEKEHKVEIRLIQCKTADDYYNQFHEKIKERLINIYHGEESVNPELAKKLAMLYMTGDLLPEDSVCLKGGFFTCHENLVNEISNKWSDIKTENIGAMKIDPEKTISRKFDQIKSDPIKRPENANQSPSGEVIYEQSIDIQKQKDIVSKIKNPPNR